jgi:acetyltransferase
MTQVQRRAICARTRKQAMLDAARPPLLRILGPNCLGLLSTRAG